MRRTSPLFALLAPALALGLLSIGCAPAKSPRLAATEPATKWEVRDGEFVLYRADGTPARAEDLIGASLTMGIGGQRVEARIDEVARLPISGGGEALFYALSSKDPTTGRFEPLCKPDIHGRSLGLPLGGYWDERGEHIDAPGRFEIACTSAATGKCVFMGYPPWRSPKARDLHQACTRMVRADYCGDGAPHTRDGTIIRVFDRAGIEQAPESDGQTFESAWSPEGAVCVQRTRVPEVLGVGELAKLCPSHFVKAPGACSEEDAKRDPRALLFVRGNGP